MASNTLQPGTSAPKPGQPSPLRNTTTHNSTDYSDNPPNPRATALDDPSRARERRLEIMLDHATKCTKGVPLRFFYDQKLLVPPTSQELAKIFPESDVSDISKRLRVALKVKNGKETGKIMETDVSSIWAELDEAYHLCPDHTFRLSECKADKNDPSKSKVDGGFFHQDDKQFLLPDCPNWEYQHYTVEFKRGGNGLDPFSDDKDIEPNADKRRAARRQLYAYASCVFDVQHRTALYMLFVNRSKFRLLRWDRSGVIVSEATDYATSKAKTKILLEVLVSLARMQDDKAAPDNMSVLKKAGILTVGAEAAGFDPTAQRLSPNSCGWARMDQLAQVEADFDVDEYNTEDHVTSGLPAEFRNNERSTCAPFTSTGSHPDPLVTMEGTAGDAWPRHLKRSTFNYIRQRFALSLKQSNVRYVLVIDNKYYLVGRAMFCADDGPIGRGTRGWIALEWHTQRFVFVKDAWHPHYVDVDPEYVMLKKLNDEKVRRVPTLIAAEVYSGQVTYLSAFACVTKPAARDATPSSSDSTPCASDGKPLDMHSPHVVNVPSAGTTASADNPPSGSTNKAEKIDGPTGIRHLQHVRMVVDEVCLPLKAFPTGLDLVRAIYHAIVAHEDAVDKGKLLHRDVSAGNILLLPRFEHYEDGTSAIIWYGILTDWEMAKSTEATAPRQPLRTGTWPFMSILWQKDATRLIGIDDELESFTHVLIFEGAIFLSHNWDVERIRTFIDQYFDQSVRDSVGGCTCSEYREKCIEKGILRLGGTELEFHSLGNDKTKLPGHPLNELLRWLLQRFKARLLVHEWEHQPAPPQKAAETTQNAAPQKNLRRAGILVEAGSEPTITSTAADVHATSADNKHDEREEQSRKDMKDMAEGLKTHAEVRAKFEEFLVKDWPSRDRAIDREAPAPPPAKERTHPREGDEPEARPSKRSKRSHEEATVRSRRSARIAGRKRSKGSSS
ncbi:uncharacterized protein BXZ73DRAFT_102643 [Epithele typhae]|uniref:uncharacterized protein n=1 Tax=Epithele typhae TaxID=378194 RepID=UPI0020088307|nr:uncharacterized protein BXZ73DRAFT_102643 [Epithele typhae]KAH9927513.1 hypothetical protein BXZ73DRAFT_102643 [Epithele typhae]